MKKYFVLGILVLFIGASILPTISGVNDVNKKIIHPKEKMLKNSFFDVQELDDFGQTAYGLTSADFNDDDNIDFAVSYATSPFSYSTISIFYNDGGASEFTQDDILTYLKYIQDLDSGDYDNDNDIDLLFTTSNKGSDKQGFVILLLNDGENHFEDPITVAMLPDRINPQVTSADFDMDGDLDFLVGDNSGQVEFYVNNGSGNFSSAGIIHNWGWLSWGVTSADFDNDGDIDFVVAADISLGANNGRLYLKKNQLIESNYSIIFTPGLGEFIGLLGWQQNTASLTPLDYNNDGLMDFVAGIRYTPYLYINRNGTFDRFYICMLPPTEEGYGDDMREGAVTSADFDNDGHPDIVTGGCQGVVRLFISKHPFAVITRPENRYYYLNDEKKMAVFPYNGVLVIRDLSIEVSNLVELDKVEFYVDRWLQDTDYTYPYSFNWTWKPILLFRVRHAIRVVAYDSNGNHTEDKMYPSWRFL